LPVFKGTGGTDDAKEAVVWTVKNPNSNSRGWGQGAVGVGIEGLKGPNGLHHTNRPSVPSAAEKVSMKGGENVRTDPGKKGEIRGKVDQLSHRSRKVESDGQSMLKASSGKKKKGPRIGVRDNIAGGTVQGGKGTCGGLNKLKL